MASDYTERYNTRRSPSPIRSCGCALSLASGTKKKSTCFAKRNYRGVAYNGAAHKSANEWCKLRYTSIGKNASEVYGAAADGRSHRRVEQRCLHSRNIARCACTRERFGFSPREITARARARPFRRSSILFLHGNLSGEPCAANSKLASRPRSKLGAVR